MSSPPDVSLRRATLADLAAVHALGDEVCALHRDARADIFAGPGEPERDDAYWRHAIAADEAHATFVAECAGAVVGFVTGRLCDEPSPMFLPVRVCQVGTLGVAAAAQGRGVGRALMARLEAWAAEFDADEMHLSVWRFNARAARLYAELGFEERAIFMGRRIAN